MRTVGPRVPVAIRAAALAALAACAAGHGPWSDAPDAPAFAEREVALPGGGAVRIALGDPDDPGGAWAAAEILRDGAGITRLDATLFHDADGDGAVGAGEARSRFGHSGGDAVSRRIWLRLDRPPDADVDAVLVAVGTTAGDAEALVRIER